MIATALITLALAGPGFSARVDHPWFPLRPGTTYVYRGRKDGREARDVVTVTRRTKRIGGAPCVVVTDRLYLDGRLAERTADWYSQDARGNVWYFGEATATLDARGRVTSTEGSWQAGVAGARAGIFMPARPRIGFAGQQEHYPGHAEDRYRVTALAGRTLTTEEWTPLEPGVRDRKAYVRGVGLVREQTVAGGSERAELVSVRRS
jgi:hypothetical protein